MDERCFSGLGLLWWEKGPTGLPEALSAPSWTDGGCGSAGSEGAERGPPSVIEGRRANIKHVGDSRAPPVGRSRRLSRARGLLARQGRAV